MTSCPEPSYVLSSDHTKHVARGSLTTSSLLQAIDRRERLRRLALETIDLSKDPYFMRNHLGQYECRLCLTLHNNEGNYLAHTQVKSLLGSVNMSMHLLTTWHIAVEQILPQE